MKKSIKIIALVLALVTLTMSFASCNSNKGREIYSLDGVSITDDLYRYWISYYKSYYVKYFSDVEDTEEGWKKEVSEGITAEQYVLDVVDKRMKMYVAALKLYEDYKLKLSDAALAEIDAAVEQQIEYYGGRSEFGSALLKSCNITIDTIEEVYKVEKKIQQLSLYLYGDESQNISGVTPITAEQLDTYYKESFSRIKYLYFDKVNKYVYNEDGSIKTNSLGSYVTEALTEEEIKDVEAKAKEALGHAKDGRDFNELIKMYNTPDMDYTKTCPDGYYVSSGSYTSSYVYTLVSNGMKMNVGDIEFYEDEYAYYVIAKYELINEAYKTDAQLEYMAKYAAESFFNKLLEEKSQGVVRDEEYLSKIKLINIGNSVNI